MGGMKTVRQPQRRCRCSGLCRCMFFCCHRDPELIEGEGSRSIHHSLEPDSQLIPGQFREAYQTHLNRSPRNATSVTISTDTPTLSTDTTIKRRLCCLTKLAQWQFRTAKWSQPNRLSCRNPTLC